MTLSYNRVQVRLQEYEAFKQTMCQVFNHVNPSIPTVGQMFVEMSRSTRSQHITLQRVVSLQIGYFQ